MWPPRSRAVSCWRAPGKPVSDAAFAELCYNGFKRPMTEQEIVLAQKEFLFPSVFHYFKEPLVVVRAKDQFVWDARGNQYLDFFGGIVTISVGHCNETV